MSHRTAFGSAAPWRWLRHALGSEWERERRETLLLLLATALTIMPHVGHIPIGCTVGFALLWLWRSMLVFSGHALPGGLVRTIATLAALGLIGSQFDSLSGREIGVAVLVMFLGLKLLELRARRDTVVVICLCFFVLLTSFFTSQTLSNAAWVWIAAQTLLIALLSVHAGPTEPNLTRRIRISSTLLLQALPLAAALFVLFPRVTAPLWGQPQTNGQGRTGLSDTMSPGSITNLVNHNEIAFRVNFESPAPDPNLLYWRGPTLGLFNGQTWRTLPHDPKHDPRPEALTSQAAPNVHYHVTLEPHAKRWLFALETPIALPEGPNLQAHIAPNFESESDQIITQRLRYRGSAQLGAAIGLNETTESLSRWLQLPTGRNPRTSGLAQTWRSEHLPPSALINRALSWLSEGGFSYTMQAPPLGTHTVDDFLFNTRAGFCEHYASAFVVLMRSLGLPARVVTGYHGAEHNSEDDYWIVRQSDAHAWAEVWLAEQGWLRVDPTHAVAPSRSLRSAVIQEGQQGWEARLTNLDQTGWIKRWRLSLDAITHQWNQWVLNYDQGRQRVLLKQIGLDASKLTDLAAALAGALTIALAVVALLTIRPARARDPVTRLYERFCQRLARAGLPRRMDETGRRFVYRIERLLDPEEAQRAHRIVTLYEDLRYNPLHMTPDRFAQLRQQVRAFRP